MNDLCFVLAVGVRRFPPPATSAALLPFLCQLSRYRGEVFFKLVGSGCMKLIPCKLNWQGKHFWQIRCHVLFFDNSVIHNILKTLWAIEWHSIRFLVQAICLPSLTYLEAQSYYYISKCFGEFLTEWTLH